jgi:hypothetical protein
MSSTRLARIGPMIRRYVERMVGIMMVQLFPNRDDLADVFQTLAYQAVVR